MSMAILFFEPNLVLRLSFRPRFAHLNRLHFAVMLKTERETASRENILPRQAKLSQEKTKPSQHLSTSLAQQQQYHQQDGAHGNTKVTVSRRGFEVSRRVLTD